VVQRTRELEDAHRQALKDQAVRERLQAQAERERLENRLHQAQRLESLGQLAGGVAHDFNNLLAVIINCASFVAEATAGDEPVQADVEQIRTAAERAARLTRQLLIFGRREKVEIEVLDLNAVVTGVHSLLARSIGEDITLVVHTASSPPMLRADKGQIEQVLLNLAVNARDAMPGGGTLTIEPGVIQLGEEYARLHPGVRAGRYTELSVSDTGVGMSPEVTARIFEPFFTTKPRGKGTGLGLATVHGVVTEAGGSLSVESEEGIGTTFRAFFPSDGRQAEGKIPAPVAAVATRGGGGGGGGGGGKTILVVEDQPDVLEITARILRRNQYSVLAATTGSEALSLAADHEFDLLLTDLVMPQISGTDLAARIRQIHPEAPVLFMSGYSQDAHRSQSDLDEDIPLIQKPFNAQALLARIQAIIAGPSRETPSP
jgi:two-component system cell cycle sensor histidine kinase/response regulator CckA